jgi:multidrug efflux pump subunit AcrA (membrane-fusion protein)
MNGTPPPDKIHPLEDNEFLPPVSRWTTLGGLAIVSFIGISVALAAKFPYEQATESEAEVVYVKEIRTIKANLSGEVRKIYVAEGDEVVYGQKIAQLDDTTSQKEKEKREIDHEEIIEKAKLSIKDLDTQIEAVNINKKQVQERIDSLKEEKSRLARERIRLQSNSYSDDSVVLEIKDEENRLQSLIDENSSEIEQLNKKMESIETEKEKLKSEKEKQELRHESIESVLNREIDKHAIKAVIDGRVTNLQISEGENIHESQEIIKILPNDNSYIVKAKLAEKYRNTLQTAQEVKIKLNACPYP